MLESEEQIIERPAEEEHEASEGEEEKAIEDLKIAVCQFVVESEQRVNQDKDYLKCIRTFTKSHKGTFQRNLFSFTKEQNAPTG